MSDSLNLGQLIGKDHKYDVSISNESAEDASARRLLEAAEAAQKRRIALASSAMRNSLSQFEEKHDAALHAVCAV